jgi:hypothetical protein
MISSSLSNSTLRTWSLPESAMKLLLNDSSVLLNLLATNRFAEIASGGIWQFAVCPAVLGEVIELRDHHTGELVPVDLGPLISSGVLQLLELSGDEEEALYIEQAIVVDDGEAMSIAIAASRHLELAIDDKQASNHARHRFPEIKLWTTPEILKHWADSESVDAVSLCATIQLIESRSRYIPPKSHPLNTWWQAAKSANLLQGCD